MNDRDFMRVLLNPFVILAVGGAVGLALWGLLTGVAAILSAGGVAVSLAVRGAAAGFVLGKSLGTVASYAIVAGGTSVTVLVMARFTKGIRKEPYRWGLPILGVITGFVVMLCDEYWRGERVVWYFLSACAALLVIVGGAFCTRKSLVLRVIGISLHLFIPVVVLLGLLNGTSGTLESVFEGVHPRAWANIGALIAIVFALMALALIAEKKKL
jgi:hypothetical protein